jgi:hypothetical protein
MSCKFKNQQTIFFNMFGVIIHEAIKPAFWSDGVVNILPLIKDTKTFSDTFRVINGAIMPYGLME